jgi:SAM-dependent methyltransferase
MRPPDLAQLTDDLTSLRAELELPGARAELVRATLPRLLATLDMIPETAREGSVLELGSSPYFLSVCLRRLCTGRLVHGNYFGTSATHSSDRLVHTRTGEELLFESDLFNIEADDFPYPDQSFDVVVFSELIEHLGLNPVRTLSEIHRVLKADGRVVITTPNALSLERLATFLRGGSQMVDRYSPLFGYGARHNREYHPRELRELLEACGFSIEKLALRDLAPLVRGERWQRALWRRLLRAYSDTPREEHIFLRARRGERFRWGFPPSLFDNMQFFTLVRHPWMEMGINDTIQCAAGWHAPEPRPGGGGEMRWIDGTGQAFLKTPEGATGVRLEVYAAAVADAPPAALRFSVWDRWLGQVKTENVYVLDMASIARGAWQRLDFPLGTFRARPGDEVEVLVALEPPDLAAHPALASLPVRERGIAVHRLEYV